MKNSFNRYIVDKNEKLINAIEKLNVVSGVGLFISDDGKLCGTLTDGDVRRWLISNKDLEAPVSLVANKDFCSLDVSQKNKAYTVMKQKLLRAIAIVDSNHKIIDIITADVVGVTTGEHAVNKIGCPVVVMAGGKGTRLYPYTKVLPKPLIPVGEIPIAEHIIDQFKKYDCRQFFFIVNHMKNMIKAYFSEQKKSYTIEFVDEDIPLGTGGGLSLLKEKIQSTFILTNCDILIRDDLSQAYKFHKENGNVITMVCSLMKEQIPYGVVEVDEDGFLIKMKEKPERTFFTNTGCYIVEPRIIENLDINKKIDFPEIIDIWKNKGEKIGVFPISSDAWLDMGQPEQLDRMRTLLE